VTTGKVTALALFSGGLDSILSCRVIMAQGIRVRAVRFVTPFFGYDLLARADQYRAEVEARYGIDVQLRDISDKYLQMLRNPAHGYGKNFNPCVDCKILIASEARMMMAEEGASFIVSGEVLGQRPMSQRFDTLRVIERDSGCEDILLRPLCARKLKETLPEREGLVDREKLLAFWGRTRTPQIELATSFGISDYPSPAGGCVLTDLNQAARIEKFYDEHELVTAADILLLLVGRQFRLPGGAWLVLGRDQRDNDKLVSLKQPGDIIGNPQVWPGPTCILRYGSTRQDMETAAGMIKRFSKKGEGRNDSIIDFREVDGNVSAEINVPPLEGKAFKDWAR